VKGVGVGVEIGVGEGGEQASSVISKDKHGTMVVVVAVVVELVVRAGIHGMTHGGE